MQAENYSVIVSLYNEQNQAALCTIIESIEKCLNSLLVDDVHILYDSSRDNKTSMLLSYLHTRPVNLYCQSSFPSIEFYSKVMSLCKHTIIHAFAYDKNSFAHFIHWSKSLPTPNVYQLDIYAPPSFDHTVSFSTQQLKSLAEHSTAIFVGRDNGQSKMQNITDKPILNELSYIKQHNITNSVIILDNARFLYNPLHMVKNSIFQTLPTLKEYLNAVLEINPAYQFVCVHDTIIAFTDQLCTVSPLSHACTISRLYDEIDGSIADVLQAEALIAQAKGTEKCALNDLAQQYTESWGHRIGLSRHYLLWKGLVLFHEKKYSEALEKFQEAYERGLTHWRVEWYIHLAKLSMEST